MARVEKQKQPLHVLHLPLPSVSRWAQSIEVVNSRLSNRKPIYGADVPRAQSTHTGGTDDWSPCPESKTTQGGAVPF